MEVLVPVTVPTPDTDNIFRVFQHQKNIYKILLFNVGSKNFSQQVGLSFSIFYFFITFLVGSGSKSGSETGIVMHSGSNSAMAKSYDSCCSGFTPLPAIYSRGDTAALQ